MKHFLVIITILFFSLTLFSSCKKKYVCDCGGQVVNPYMEKLSKSEASSEKTKCEANPGCTFKRDK